MASSKRPTYKVETKLATERKRRKSDLVVMWHSIWGVTTIIVKELWMTFIRMWEFIQLWFSSSERFLVQTWLEKFLPYVPEDFSESWRDGRLLAILLNKLQPGCFPDAACLDPNYGLKNVYRVFDTLEMYFGIKPNVLVEEIVTCSDGSDSKLFAVLLELKNLTDSKPENEHESTESELAEIIEPSGVSENCIAKGTGLAVGFVGRMANFILFCAAMSDLDVVVEIRGPNSICSERITKRSPKKKRSVSTWECVRHLTRSESFNEDNNCLVTEEDENFEKRIIPLEYEIMRNQINLGYKPRENGKHKVTILWHGQHVSDSPYFVAVEDPFEIAGTNHVIQLKSALKITNEGDKGDLRKISVRFQESQRTSSRQDRPSGKVLRRKVLRYIVKIHGKDIPVNAESTESLATELLKMDYDFETCPSFHRRNSWGFAGDAERKKSVIRQFGIDINELDAQISQRRSRSLSVNPGSKKSLKRSDSLDNLALKLDILSEDVFDSSEKAHENEVDYAYIYNVNVRDGLNVINTDDTCEKSKNINSDEKIEAVLLSSELTESKFNNSMKESSVIESEKISSLSADAKSVESSKEDLQENILPYCPFQRFNQLNLEKTDRISFNYQFSSMELNSNGTEQEKTVPEISKCVEISFSNKIMEGKLKIKAYRKKKLNISRSFKRFIIKRKVQKRPMKTFNRKVYRSINSIPASPAAVFRERQGRNKLMLEIKSNITGDLGNLDVKDSEKSNKSEFKHEIKDSIIGENQPKESLNMSQTLALETMNNKNDTPSIEEQCIKTEVQRKSAKISHTLKNITNVATKDMCKPTENVILEPKIKKLVLNHNLKKVPKSLLSSKMEIKDDNTLMPEQQQMHALKPVGQSVLNHSLEEFSTRLTQSDVKSKDVNIEKPKPLRTHTLKTLGQFNFKQFNPPLDTQSNVSPIKIQIGHWESTLSTEQQDNSSQKSCASETEQVNVKEKLAFWENTYKAEQNSSPKNTLENNRKINLVVNKKFSVCDTDSKRNDLQNPDCTGNDSNVTVLNVKEDNKTFINQQTNVATKKQTDDKISLKFQVDPHKIRRRSFSDPVVSENTLEKADDSVNFPNLKPSGKEYSSSSTDDNLEQYDSDDSEDSGGDYRLISTEDEYIDDEISERASEYWGDLSIVKSWKVSQCTSDYSVLGEEILQSYCQRDKSYPEECKVFGIAVYYGYVAIKNRFQVYTGDAGFGNISVSMQGFRQHEVSLISIAYIRNDIYEITYQVMTAGYYLIWIRWMDREIPGSPFVCKVTF